MVTDGLLDVVFPWLRVGVAKTNGSATGNFSVASSGFPAISKFFFPFTSPYDGATHNSNRAVSVVELS